MRKILTLFLLIQFSLNVSAKTSELKSQHQCQNVLSFIYKELTLNQLANSYESTKNKFLIGLQYFKNNRKHKKDSKEVKKIINTLRLIDPKFKSILKLRGGWFNNIFSKKETLNNKSLKGVIDAWIKLQHNRPDLFKGLPEKYLLNLVDSYSMGLIDEVEKYNFSNTDLKERIKSLKETINKSRTNILESKRLRPKQAKVKFESTKKLLLTAMKDQVQEILTEFKDVCSLKQLNQYIHQENLVCPLPKTESDFLKLTKQIRSMEDILIAAKPEIDESLLIKPDEPEEEPGRTPSGDIEINILDYDRSEDPKSTYCKRDPNIVTTIVIHHTATPKTYSPLSINRDHRERTTSDGEPWYMVGYNYLVSESYDGASAEIPKVFQGREQNIRGAHAGGFSKPLTKEQKNFFGQFEVECGNEIIGFKKKNALKTLNAQGGIHGNLISHGIAIIGNFTPISVSMISGVPMIANLHTAQEIEKNGVNLKKPSPGVINQVAKLSCKLQKQNPNIKTIVPHLYYKRTTCPGSMVLYIKDVVKKAKEYGCYFEMKLSKEEK